MYALNVCLWWIFYINGLWRKIYPPSLSYTGDDYASISGTKNTVHGSLISTPSLPSCIIRK